MWGQQGVANELGGPGDALAQKLLNLSPISFIRLV